MLATAALACAMLACWPSVAAAHAFLQSSSPQANEIVPVQPGVMTLTFTEPIEPQYSDAQLFDATGAPVPGAVSTVGPGPNQLTLTLPGNLPHATYTVQWRDISAADGHPQSGYVPFTIGNQQDVVTPTAPKITTFNLPPTWLNATGRWLSLLGVCAAAGALLCWLWAIRPSLRAAPPEHDVYDRAQARLYRLGMAACGVALLGSVIALGVQTATTGSAFAFHDLLDVLTSTRYGYYWMLRVVLILALATAYNSPSFWDDPPPWWVALSGLVVGGAALIPFALISHAAAQPVGSDASTVADWLHLLGAAAWIGGLLALLAALVYGLRGSGLTGAERRAIFAMAVPRFSTLAIVSVVVLVSSGFYSAWLEVGNLAGLRDTDYGHALLLKLALLVPLLLLGALNLLVVGPRLRDAARAGRHFSRAIAAEAMLGIGILFVVGLLTSLPTARETLTAEGGRDIYHWARSGVHVQLFVAPGAVGPNRYTVDAALDSGDLPVGSQVLLDFTADKGVEGTREVELQPKGGARYEAIGSELSVVGGWQVNLIVRRPNTADWSQTLNLNVAQTPPASRVPGTPPRFASYNAAFALLFAAVAILTVVWALRQTSTRRDRVQFAGLGAALALSAVAILATTYTTATPGLATNPVPVTAASVAAGQQLFAANCATCHGPGGQGNGPQAPTLTIPPADLTAAHVDTHTDADLQFWIANGLGTAMPGFKSNLSVTQMWDVVNFVRSLRHPVQGAQGP